MLCRRRKGRKNYDSYSANASIVGYSRLVKRRHAELYSKLVKWRVENEEVDTQLRYAYSMCNNQKENEDNSGEKLQRKIEIFARKR